MTVPIRSAYSLVALAVAMQLAAPSLAQQHSPANLRRPKKPSAIFGTGNKADLLRYQQMRTPPTDLPNMQTIAPSGSRFYYGLKSVNNKGMTNLQLHYKTRLDSGSALQTYANQFQQPNSGWRVLPPARNRVGAMFGSNSCVVQYIAGNRGSNEVIINYQFHAAQ